MANVKLTKKTLLDKFQARLVIDRGEKITQQELLDKCIEFSHEHYDEFVKEKLSHPALTPELKQQILDMAVDCPVYHPEKSDDELIYGL